MDHVVPGLATRREIDQGQHRPGVSVECNRKKKLETPAETALRKLSEG